MLQFAPTRHAFPPISRPAAIVGDDRIAFSVEEAARLLGIGRTSAYRACARGEIPTIRIGSRILIPRVALERLLG